LNDRYLPVWLQDAGYNTYYAGKLFNAHTVDNYDKPFPKAWTGSDFLLDPYTYSYLNGTWQRNRDPPVSAEGNYTTDVLADKVQGFLEEGVKGDKPFFLVAAPIAPHSNLKSISIDLYNPKEDFEISPPIPAKRHEHLFNDVKIPRKSNFNPEKVRQLKTWMDSNEFSQAVSTGFQSYPALIKQL
jgi:N-acetylglucosamine-6-sulfatase